MLEENLSKLGLSPSEIKIYLHLINYGSIILKRSVLKQKLIEAMFTKL